jgi:hypothetical protein
LVFGCAALQQLPALPQAVKPLNVEGCSSLRQIL